MLIISLRIEAFTSAVWQVYNKIEDHQIVGHGQDTVIFTARRNGKYLCIKVGIVECSRIRSSSGRLCDDD
jgi:hypothetical protein